MDTESRAAMAKISAHETTGLLQALSTAALISSTTENPLIELIFGFVVFSPVKFLVSSNTTDPSQSCVSKIDSSINYAIYDKSLFNLKHILLYEKW